MKHQFLLQQKEILDFLIKNPGWVSAFATGEGCFMVTYVFSERALWGIWPVFEFNITQSLIDVELLKAIKDFYGNVGEVYDKKNGIGVYKVRAIPDIVKHI